MIIYTTRIRTLVLMLLPGLTLSIIPSAHAAVGLLDARSYVIRGCHYGGTDFDTATRCDNVNITDNGVGSTLYYPARENNIYILKSHLGLNPTICDEVAVENNVPGATSAFGTSNCFVPPLFIPVSKSPTLAEPLINSIFTQAGTAGLPDIPVLGLSPWLDVTNPGVTETVASCTTDKWQIDDAAPEAGPCGNMPGSSAPFASTDWVIIEGAILMPSTDSGFVTINTSNVDTTGTARVNYFSIALSPDAEEANLAFLAETESQFGNPQVTSVTVPATHEDAEPCKANIHFMRIYVHDDRNSGAARLTWSLDGGLTFEDIPPTNFAQHGTDFACEFGDAPISYEVDPLFAPGAHQAQVPETGLTIGSEIDYELVVSNGASATGDDTNQSTNDEEGITFISSPASGGFTATVSGVNLKAVEAMLCGYLDGGANGSPPDGIFDRNVSYTTVGQGAANAGAGNEEICIRVAAENNPGFSANYSPTAGFNGASASCTDTAATTGAFTCTLNWQPNYLIDTATYARFRLTTDANFFSNSSPSPTGNAIDGEMEDFGVVVAGTEGSIQVTKTVIGDPATATAWEFTLSVDDAAGCDISGVTPNPLTTPAAGGSGSFNALPTTSSVSGLACQYSVSETEQTNWAVQETNPQTSLVVTTGNTTQVNFSNVAQGEIAVTKTVVGDSTAAFPWVFTLSTGTTGCSVPAVPDNPLSTPAAGGTVTFTNLDTHNSSNELCTYAVSETTQMGWDITALACSNSSGAVGTPDIPNAQATGISLKVADPVACGFENTQWPDLAISKTVNPPDQIAGGNLTYTVTVQNPGGMEATQVEVTDILSPGQTYVSDSPSQGDYDEITGIWDVGTLAAGSSATLDIVVVLEPDQAACAIDYTNEVEITNQGEPDYDNSNHNASVGVSLTSIGIAKRLSDASPIDMGGDVYNVIYELLLENNGAVDLVNVQITDDLNAMLNTPNINNASFRVLSISSPNNTLSSNSAYDGAGDLNLLDGSDSLAIGAQGRLDLEIEVIPSLYYGPFENQASASGESSITGGIIAIDLSEEGDAVSAPDPATVCVTDSPTPLQLSIPTTPITLGWFKTTDLSGGQVLFEWSTESEVGNVGFYLWYQDEQGAWVKINEAIIASEGDTLSVRNYEYHAWAVEGLVYRITDVSISGSQTHHAGYDLGHEYGTRSERKATNWNSINRESEEKQRLRKQQQRELLRQRLQSYTN